MLYPAEGTRLSDHISRDSGAGDAPMVSQKIYPAEVPILSDHISRDSGAGDAPMVSQKIYPAEVPILSDHISRDSGAGDAPMVSKKFNRCPGEYQNTLGPTCNEQFQFTEIKSGV